MSNKSHNFDTNVEKRCLKTLVKIADLIRSHNELIKNEAKKQDGICGALWNLSQRLSIIRRNTSNAAIYPTDIKGKIECELLNEFHNRYLELQDSIERICISFDSLQLLLKGFNLELRNFNHNCPDFIQGNTKIKPVHFYLEFIDRAVNYFQDFLISTKNLMLLIRPNESEAIESYQNVLQSDRKEFDEYLKSTYSYFKVV